MLSPGGGISDLTVYISLNPSLPFSCFKNVLASPCFPPTAILLCAVCCHVFPRLCNAFPGNVCRGFETSQKTPTMKGNHLYPPAAHDKGHGEVGTATRHGCRDEGVCMLLLRCLAPNQASFSNHSNICGFFPIPLIAKLLSSSSWCQMPLAVPTRDGVPREGTPGWSTRGRRNWGCSHPAQP